MLHGSSKANIAECRRSSGRRSMMIARDSRSYGHKMSSSRTITPSTYAYCPPPARLSGFTGDFKCLLRIERVVGEAPTLATVIHMMVQHSTQILASEEVWRRWILEIGTSSDASEVVIDKYRTRLLVEGELLPRCFEVYAVVPCVEDEGSIPLVVSRDLLVCERRKLGSRSSPIVNVQHLLQQVTHAGLSPSVTSQSGISAARTFNRHLCWSSTRSGSIARSSSASSPGTWLPRNLDALLLTCAERFFSRTVGAFNLRSRFVSK